jgi:hypothetical protein
VGVVAVEGVHQLPVPLADEPAPHLAGPGELAVVGIELLVEDEEPPDLGRRQPGLRRQVAVDLFHAAPDQLGHLVVGGQVLVAPVG